MKARLCAMMLAGLATPAAAVPAPAAPAAKGFTVGAVRVFALRDALNVVPNDGKTFGTDVGPQAVAGVLTAAGAPADPITLSVDALLVRLPGRIVLIDTGLGPPAHGVLLASLAKAHVAPAQVTDVLITHLHPDHVGGLLGPDGRPAFPNATVRMARTEWQGLRARPQAAALVAAIADRVVPFAPGDTPVPGIATIALPGHTPGHTLYRITSRGQTLLDMGDVAHSSIVSLAKPGWTIAYDGDAAAGRAAREATLAKLAAEHTLVFAPHFPFPGVGRIERAGDGYRWVPARP